MIDKCANPECPEPFRYFRGGRLFQVDHDDTGHRILGPFLVSESGGKHRLEHFWLCAGCARRMTLTIDSERGVIPVLFGSQARKRAA